MSKRSNNQRRPPAGRPPASGTLSRRRRTQLLYSALAGLLVVALFLLLHGATQWQWYVNWLIAVNIITFGLYAIDKALSKTNAARIPEATLHVLAVAGGFLGALIGMITRHHKSNFREHPSFLLVIILSGAGWGALLYYFLR